MPVRPTPRPLVAAGLALASAAGFAAPALAQSQDIIVVEVTDGGQTVTLGGSDLLSLLQDAIESQGAFAGFDGTAFTATLDWGGVSDVVQVSVNAAGTSATLSFPITGFSQTFTGISADDLENQIEDFILENGASQYAQVIEALNRLSAVAIVDGNPGAATARIGRTTFRRWGMAPTFTPGVRVGGNLADPGGLTTLGLEFGVLDRGDFETTSAALDLMGLMRLNDTVGFAIGGTVIYDDLEGADVLQAGLEFALPITFGGAKAAAAPATDDPADPAAAGDEAAIFEPEAGAFVFQVTPVAILGLGGSADLGTGASFWGVGVAASASRDFGPFTLSGGASIISYDGLDLSWEDYEFETNVDQRLLTVGGLVTVPLSEGVDLSAGVSWSNLLDDAAVEDWISPEVGLTFGQGSLRANVGWVGTFADDVDGHALRARLHWGF